MARRRFAEEPISRLAIWARRCAFFALAATVLSILIVRSGILEIVPALATFVGALVFAVFGIVLAFGAFIVIWKDGIARHGPCLRRDRYRARADRLSGLSRRPRLPSCR